MPAVNIGTRQSGRERGENVLDVDYNRAHIHDAIRTHIARTARPRSNLYGDGNSGARIADLLCELKPRIEKRLTY